MSESAEVLYISRSTRVLVNRDELEAGLEQFHATYDAVLTPLHRALKAMQKELKTIDKTAWPTLFHAESAVADIIHHFDAPSVILKGEAVTYPRPKRAAFTAADNALRLTNYLEGVIRHQDMPDAVRQPAADAYLIISEKLRDTLFQHEYEALCLQLEAFCRQTEDEAREWYVAKPEKYGTSLVDALMAARTRMGLYAAGAAS